MELSAFFETVGDDPRITTTHVSLYFALLSEWQLLQVEVFDLDRQKLMTKAKLGARSTYDKAMQDLHDFGYIRYERGRGYRKGKVKLNRL